MTVDVSGKMTPAAMEAATAAPTPLFAPRQMPLRSRLILLVAGTLIPMLLLTAAVVLQSYRSARQAAAEQVLQVTRGAMVAVERELANQIAALEVLALAPSLQTGDFAAFRDDAERFLTRFPAQTAISVSDARGNQVFSSYPLQLPSLVRPAVLEAVAAVFAGKGPQVSDLYISRRTGDPTFTVNVPVRRGADIVYALSFNPPRAVFADILTRLELPDGWVLGIFDRAARHVARRPSLSFDAITSASDSLRAAFARSDESISETTSVEGTRVLTGFTRSAPTGWAVALGVPLEEFEAPALRSLGTAFAAGAALLLAGGFFALRIARQLLRAEGHRELLVNELNHRVKNTLAAVQAIVWQGLRGSGAAPETRRGIDARLGALSGAHNLLSRRGWEGARLDEVVGAIAAPYAGDAGARVRGRGPAIALSPRVAIALSMVINELATNAVKHGALSAAGGVVDVTWSMPEPGVLRLEWTESGGPRVLPPDHTGFGTRIIERAVGEELHGIYTASFPPDGLRCVIEARL